MLNKYRANFLWPHEKKSIEEAGYEFANGKTEPFCKDWWDELLIRAKADLQAERDALREFYNAHCDVERGTLDFDLRAKTVDRLARARKEIEDGDSSKMD